jgi:hypothetical protein
LLKEIRFEEKPPLDISLPFALFLYVRLPHTYLFGNDINEGRIKTQNVF